MTAYKDAKGVQVDYNGIGSGGGIKNITDKTVDFAGSDAPMNDKEIAAAGGMENLVMFPSTAGGVVPIYNLPGSSGELHLTGEVLADVYLGQITTWNDAKIKALNPGADLPATPITPVYRTDGSGTTFVFTSYLATQSAELQAVRRRQQAGELADRPGGQGQPRHRRGGQQDARRAGLRRAGLRPAEQDQLRGGEEQERQVRQGDPARASAPPARGRPTRSRATC